MNIAIKSAVAFFILLVYTRFLGKKQMNQLTYFNYIIGITLGSTAATISVDENIPFINGIISMTMWVFLAFLISLITMKSYTARNLLDGEPDIIIKKGRVMGDKIKKAHLNMDDVTMLLRENGIFSISDVEYAILEPHGKLSILKKPELETVTKKDLSIAENPVLFVPTDLIIDGNVLKNNLNEIGLDEDWLKNELLKNDIKWNELKNIFYLAIEKDGRLYIDWKTDNV